MNIEHICQFIRDTFQTDEFVPLHAPTFVGNEKRYVMDTIDSTFVSSVGKYVDEFEQKIESFTQSPKAVAVVNGSAALQMALYSAGVKQGDLVLTQALTFVATCNVLYHLGAQPIFIDVSETSLSLCPNALERYLNQHATITERGCIHKTTGQRIKALMPMHTFGHPAEMDELGVISKKWQLQLIEDAAESLGSMYKGRHTGTIGDFGAISFNGNKIITTGGGGVVLCASSEAGQHVKHITTTAKVPHAFEFYHDEPGFNHRLPNINAALGCAQMEVINELIASKRVLAMQYREFFAGSDFQFVEEPCYAKSNYWLNAVICPSVESRNTLLNETNSHGVMTRPVWTLMHHLPMFKNALRGDLSYSQWLSQHLVNIPSSALCVDR
ncbi:LegC family aminotransferase [Shewanella gaetbuli]|uniref:LegC family aminotransferase n=1 Tax=Shewanella gaetbuli TaxID=220752 RepID=A0A9X1ZHA6_9GAMM|nr:LegC family aminotransferase [Shewanella gaetbuli]MCL1141728.1 LegC family aminotransferase [Shewanella gaetbuli]